MRDDNGIEHEMMDENTQTSSVNTNMFLRSRRIFQSAKILIPQICCFLMCMKGDMEKSDNGRGEEENDAL